MRPPLNLCSGCGKDFASIRYFDAHRVGDYAPGDYHGPPEKWTPAEGRRCLSTAELERLGYALDARGRWTDPKRAERGRRQKLIAAGGVSQEATEAPAAIQASPGQEATPTEKGPREARAARGWRAA